MIFFLHLDVFDELACFGRDDVGAEDVAEIWRAEKSGFMGPEEPYDVGPAPKWGIAATGAEPGFEFGGEVGFGDDGAAGRDEGVVVEASGWGLGRSASAGCRFLH